MFGAECFSCRKRYVVSFNLCHYEDQSSFLMCDASVSTKIQAASWKHSSFVVHYHWRREVSHIACKERNHEQKYSYNFTKSRNTQSTLKFSNNALFQFPNESDIKCSNKVLKKTFYRFGCLFQPYQLSQILVSP